ncbi:hypothetical protein PV08_11524 [Exophiala spinifera]|uniref:Uncharacterized protein n=1 Tax=Exophiala spinifera TaxID=91928 RepID=A0A0D2AVV9_9EURO|nr:uncharacterized protein PV08_11524 [Exophiala spinifera]KIW10560.1 hypothetical protein PV08_11524 [Exophiala spinifera]
MSRNKENNPLSSTRRHGTAASLGANIPSEDFFTDSMLGDDSRIPSPSPQKVRPVRARRAAGLGRALQATKDSGNRAQRTSLAEYTSARLSRIPQPPLSVETRISQSPHRTNVQSTPPQSRSGPPLTSPAEFSSPPPGLTDVYQRIADEEDLAATEREGDSDEGAEVDGDDTLGSALMAGPSDDTGDVEQVASGVSTPENKTLDTNKPRDMVEDQSGSFSAPPTLDFVQNELSDRVLAAKLTPHVVNSAKDRERLNRMRHSRVPINFKQSPRQELNGSAAGPRQFDLAKIAARGPISFENVPPTKVNGAGKAHSDTSVASPQKKVQAFSKASSRAIKREEDDDGSDTPDELRDKERAIAFSRAIRKKEPLHKDENHWNPDGGPKPVALSRANGHSRPYGQIGHANGSEEQAMDPNETITTTASEPIPNVSLHADSRPRSEALDKTRSLQQFLSKWRHENAKRQEQESRKLAAEPDSSQVDWAAAAADVPLPSVERSSTSPDKSSTPQGTPPRDLQATVQKQRSVEKFRVWGDNDFTGISFQVSDSPPIRSQAKPDESQTKTKTELQRLAQGYITTNRLNEMSAKNPSIVRKTSRSFSPEERRLSQPDRAAENRRQDSENLGEGERIPDTPVVVYRSSSNNSDNSSRSQRPTPESQRSLDHLQRLARAVSTTPKASPPPENPVDVDPEDTTGDDILAAYGDVEDTATESSPVHEIAESQSKAPKVMATPKVVGAWTDTILPGTVRTQRSILKQPKHLQTPHVNAGAWVDTPLPNGEVFPAPSMPEIIEEATEDLTHGVNAASEQPPIDQQTSEPTGDETLSDSGKVAEARPSLERPLILPQSALTNVLNEAKQRRLASQDITDSREDTLNLGDATIQSFEDLLTDAADITADLTSLIRTNAEDEVVKQRQLSLLQDDADSTAAEMAFIGHLTSRMERLMSNLHEARKGISRLEQRVSTSPSPPPQDKQTLAQSQALMMQNPNQPCVVCGHHGNVQHVQHDHRPLKMVSTNSFLPMTYSTFTIPIPLLFYPRRKDKGQILPRPTWLGWVTIVLWSWYITECVMAEIYAHPVYAEFYVWPAVPEPEFPFVLPTMIYRWTHMGSFLPIMGRVVVAVWRAIAMMLGLSDGFVDETVSQVASAAMEGATAFANAAGEGPDLSMMNDEFI